MAGIYLPIYGYSVPYVYIHRIEQRGPDDHGVQLVTCFRHQSTNNYPTDDRSKAFHRSQPKSSHRPVPHASLVAR
jgi:hypothetical protein